MAIRYYFANWKMFQSLTDVKKFCTQAKKSSLMQSMSDTYLGIAASYEHIYIIQQKLQSAGIAIGAQDCSNHLLGAYTGQVCVQSLADMNLDFCIIGHSETRQFLGQSDELIASKFKLLVAANISPIFCIGETLQQKQAGMTLQVLCDQLEIVLQFLQSYQGQLPIFIAYEPIYAIGTGDIPSHQDLQQVFSFLKQLIEQLPVAKNVMFLYGGSVSSKTVSYFSQIEEISGFLIGKASIDFQELKKIVESK